MGRAQALKLVILDHPEQLGLHLQWQLPDLVETKGGTIGDLEQISVIVYTNPFKDY